MNRKSVVATLIIIGILLINVQGVLGSELPTHDELNRSIEAEAAIVMDAETGQVLYEKNGHIKMYPASTTKLMTALITMEALNPEDSITFSEEIVDSVDYDTTRIGVRAGETITIDEAFHAMLLMSANEVANGLAAETSGSIEAFVSAMNERAQVIGATSTNFTNAHGLYDERHYTTCFDMALITREVIKDDYFLTVMDNYMYEISPTNLEDEIRYMSQMHKMVNGKNDMKIYREDVIAGKVGFTTESGHTLVTVAEIDGRQVIVVIMKTPAKNLYSDTNKLLDYGLDGFTSDTYSGDNYIEKILINEDGEVTGEVTLGIAVPTKVLIPQGKTMADVNIRSNSPEELSDKVSMGQVVSSVTLLVNDNVLTDIPLVVQNVKLAGTDGKSSSVSTTLAVEDKKDQVKETNNDGSLIKVIVIIIIIIALLTGLYFAAKVHREYLNRKMKAKYGRKYKG